MILLHSQIDRPLRTQNLHFNNPRFKRAAEITNSLQQRIRLPNLLRRLLQPSLRNINLPITLPHMLPNIRLIIKLKPQLPLLLFRQRLVLFPQVGQVGFGAGAEVLFCVGEEVVGAGAGEVGAADFGVGEGEGLFSRGAGHGHEVVAHELFEEFALFCCHFWGRGGRVGRAGGGRVC